MILTLKQTITAYFGEKLTAYLIVITTTVVLYVLFGNRRRGSGATEPEEEEEEEPIEPRNFTKQQLRKFDGKPDPLTNADKLVFLSLMGTVRRPSEWGCEIENEERSGDLLHVRRSAPRLFAH